MKLSLCPMCRKGGLRWKDPDGKDPQGWTPNERVVAWRRGETAALTVYDQNLRYCPRCDAWVKPIVKHITGGQDGQSRPSGSVTR
jgi:hypothetical protein